MLEQPRIDMYRPIHKALRLLMAETLVEAGRMDCEDVVELHAVLDRVDSLLQACSKHLEHENAYVHPALERAEPGASARTAVEHHEHLAAITVLQRQVRAVREATPALRQHAADALYDHLADFVAENFAHMRIEERDNNARLWAHYDDAALIAIHDALVASIPPAEMTETLKLMLRALAAGERAGLLGSLREAMPAEVFEGLLGELLPVLSSRDRAKLRIALGDERVAA
jgi:hemerythrin-like domain-containing protein